MIEYIDREETLYYFNEIMGAPGENELADELYGIVLETHGCDVVPVRHGHFMPHPNPKYVGWKVCSVCIGTIAYNYKYCPWCGAKMDEEAQ